MDILVLIDRLDDLMHNARPVPLTDQVRLDAQPVYDVLDEIRAQVAGLNPEAGPAAAEPAAAGVDSDALTAAVSAAIRENIPAIAQATAAAVGGARAPQPPPGGPF